MSGFKSGLALGAEISSGFFGKVFNAHDPVRGNVAVKVLHQYPGEADAAWIVRKETLLDEGQKLIQAEHPNVVRVHHLVKQPTDDTLHLVMDLCKGLSPRPVRSRANGFPRGKEGCLGESFLAHAEHGDPKQYRLHHDDTTQRYQNALQFFDALSTLACDPCWNCNVSPGKITWGRSSATRIFKVAWTEHSPKKHEWSANSFPAAAGRKRSLGAAIGSKGDCVRALNKFFSS